MESRSAQDSGAVNPIAFLARGGEMGERIRAFDWTSHALGPPAGWPQSLKTIVRVMLNSRYQMFVWWGNELWNFYNDAYASILGKRHPSALGQQADQIWKEIWDVVGPQAFQVLHQGQATWNAEMPLIMERNGYVEECFFTYSYSPVPSDDGGIGGVFCACSEDTFRVLGERRLECLRDLGAPAIAAARTSLDACRLAALALQNHSHDVPFAILYLASPDRRELRLAGCSGIEPGTKDAPEVLSATGDSEPAWPAAQALSGKSITLTGLGNLRSLPGGPWPEPADTAVVLPLLQGGSEGPAGIVVLGASPRRPFDDSYRGFFDLLSVHLGALVANARAFEEEQRRAEVLAELDRAKTAFFSNVSHEFRTPLTLMLGPVEDLLVRSDTELPPSAKRDLDVVSRNGLRLLRLVNTLLDFSRIEAGRVQAVFEATDLATFTADLASVFRAACERAGLAFAVECPPLAELVYVDRDMWEKIVLNLVSNAFKFTFSGGIFVTLRQAEGHVELSVRDTGTGIPQDALPRLFERFYRVKNAQGRTHEGSGIGLALVQELVKLHGGGVRAHSVVGEGTTFTVQLPLGSAHLPREQVGGARSVASTALGPRAYVEEALRWLPDDERSEPAGQAHKMPQDDALSVPAPAAAGPLPRVLVADDNTDMRQYVARLLGERYQVETVRDGATALAAAMQSPPDLVLTDVMMPGMNGFELLKALRTDSRTAAVPVIMLSARAGEESRVEGMDAGADDYLVKPFSARELLARVKAHLDIARVRRQSLEQLRDADRKKDEFLATLAHELRNPLAPIRNSLHLLRLGQSDPEVNGQVLEIMERQIKHMARLVDDLLEVSRITRGKLEIRKDRVELAAVVRGAVETSQPLIEAASHQLAISLPSEPLTLEADAVRISQVLANLLNNAAKYMDPGGQIFLTARREGNEIVISVKDTGVGISAEMLPRVFDMFLQVNPAVGRARTGLGIGLALARNLVELHGGSLVGHSRGLGHGSEFVVRLPLASPSAGAANAAQRPPRKATLAGQRIVVADDNRDAANSLGRLLRVLGAEVQIVYDGAAALAALQQWPTAIVLLDLGMPGMDGYEIARRIREQPELSAVALIALTGWGQEEDRRRTEEAGFDHHLTKPADVAALQALLTSLRTPEERAKVRHAR